MAQHGRDVGPEAVGRMTNGTRSIDIDELGAIAASLGLPVVDLLISTEIDESRWKVDVDRTRTVHLHLPRTENDHLPAQRSHRDRAADGQARRQPAHRPPPGEARNGDREPYDTAAGKRYGCVPRRRPADTEARFRPRSGTPKAFAATVEVAKMRGEYGRPSEAG